MPPKAAHRRAASGRHRANATAGRTSRQHRPNHATPATIPELRKLLASGTVLGVVAIAAAGVARVEPSTSPELVFDLAAISDERAILAEKAISRSAADRVQGVPAVPSPSPSKSPKASASPKPSPTRKAAPTPVAGLTQRQMNNAATIVRVGQGLGLPKRALIIGVATAMQESDLYNIASDAVPESYDYPHEGASVDHDSVGLFQQRPSQGWGTVSNLMKPAYQAKQFFERLADLDWQNMSLTQAAQAVQISAFPDAYAKHESRATTIVNALT